MSRTLNPDSTLRWSRRRSGVVADSDPMSEWMETQHKARALMRAAEVATAEHPRQTPAAAGGGAER